MRIIIASLLACLVVLGVSSCVYPEQGFYALVGVNGVGERVAYLPFMVDELTDDTHMTIGFTVLLPHYGQLVEIPLQNGEDLSRRYWLLNIANADCNAGNLQLELDHADERLSLDGLYQATAGGDVQHVSGYMVPLTGGVSQLVYTTEKPQLPELIKDVLYFEVKPIERADFEDFLGSTVDKTKRVPASTVPDLAQIAKDAAANADKEQEQEPEPKPEPKKPKKQPPVLGGRR